MVLQQHDADAGPGVPDADRQRLHRVRLRHVRVPLQDAAVHHGAAADVGAIRDDDAYGGYRVSIVSEFDTIATPMQIDITTGDVITPKEILYLFKMIFKEGSIGIWTYNIETVLAEKAETILRRGELNTRPRDFYDVYILTKTQSINNKVFAEALRSTAAHRGTNHIFNNISNRLEEIEESETLRARWNRYTKDYRYADKISYEDITGALKALINNF